MSGFTSTATSDALGTASCSSSSRFGPTSVDSEVAVVRFPPGRLRLATKPSRTPLDKGTSDFVREEFAAEVRKALEAKCNIDAFLYRWKLVYAACEPADESITIKTSVHVL